MMAHHRSRSLLLLGLLVLGLARPLHAFSVPSIPSKDSLRRRQRPRTPDRMVDHHQPRQAHALLSTVNGGAEESIPLLSKLKSFSEKNFFVLGMLVAVSLARLFPEVYAIHWCGWKLSLNGEGVSPLYSCSNIARKQRKFPTA